MKLRPRVKAPSRDEFFVSVKTLEPQTVNVAEGDTFPGATEPACLIQIGVEGNYTCAYLNDEQVKTLAKALLDYLRTE